MKKAIIVSIVILASASFCMAADYPLKSLLGVPFGQICDIKAEFIDKPNTYYAQNMSKAGYYLRILEINGIKLAKPLVAEPVYTDIRPQKNKTYKFRAYETIRSEGEPRGWSGLVQQFDYTIGHRIVIKE
jgi:hypothetical protein